MSSFNIALIGCGPRGVNGHGHRLRESEVFNLAAVCDLDEERAAKAAAALKCEAVTDYKKLLRRKTIDAVAIVTATEFHLDIALRAAKAGKHILLEKPLTHDFPSAVRLYRTAAEAGIKGMVCYQLRFHPFYEELKRQTVKIQPLQIYTSRQCGLMGAKYLHARAQAGLLDFCSHDFDVVLWLMDLPPKRLFATLGRGLYTDSQAVDLLSVQVEFGDSKAPRVAHLVSSMGGMGIPRRYDVVGRHGNLTQEGNGIKRTLITISDEGRSSADSEVLRVPATVPDPTHLLHNHFAAWLHDDSGKFTARATFRDGVNSLLLADAAVESSRTGNVVNLEDFAARHGYSLTG